MIFLLCIETNRYIFKKREIWFSDYPFDIKNLDFIFFRSCKNDIVIDGFRKEEFTTHIIDLNQDISQIWKNFGRSSARYAINRAVKDGISVEINKDYDKFIELNRSFRKKKHIGEQNIKKDYYEKNGVLFLAFHNKELLSGQFYVRDDKNIRWLIGASRRLEADNEKATMIGNANRFLVWSAINYAKSNNISEFDLGGYYTGKEDNPELERINKFKQSFGGVLAKRYNYHKIYSKKYKLAERIYNLKNFIGI